MMDTQTTVEEPSISKDEELRLKIDVAERWMKFSSTTAESKKRTAVLISSYKKQLAKIEKKVIKKDG
jgi:hypothetical protein